jgi:hypothetical protein
MRFINAVASSRLYLYFPTYGISYKRQIAISNIFPRSSVTTLLAEVVGVVAVAAAVTVADFDFILCVGW